MSEEEKTKILTLDDLLGSDADRTKTVYIDELGGSIVINRLTLGDLAKVNAYNRSKGWEDDDMRSTIGIIQRGVASPQLQYSQVEQLPLQKATAIVQAISDFAGWTPEVLESARNLSDQTTEST